MIMMIQIRCRTDRPRLALTSSNKSPLTRRNKTPAHVSMGRTIQTVAIFVSLVFVLADKTQLARAGSLVLADANEQAKGTDVVAAAAAPHNQQQLQQHKTGAGYNNIGE